MPLSLLAAQTIADLVNRRVPVRTLIGLAPATAMSVAWWASADLREAVDDVFHGRADAATALGLHLALDLVVVSVWIIARSTAGLAAAMTASAGSWPSSCWSVLAVTAVDGLREVLFRHSDRPTTCFRSAR